MKIDPVNLSKDLISLPSITPDNTNAIDSLLFSTLKDIGFSCNILHFGSNINISNNKRTPIKNLYARLGNKSPNLCFAGHTDVVPPGDLEQWLFPPFSPKIHNNTLYGRGTVDMKSAICAFIAAVADIIDTPKINGSVSLIITGDEEGSNYQYGTKAVLEWLKEQNQTIDYCIVGEPTSDIEFGDTIKIGRRGSMTFKLTCYGTQGHVAYPEKAENPIYNMIKILSKIRETTLDNGNEYFQPSNCEITTIDVGNQAANVIPGSVTAQFNIRYNNEHNSDSLEKLIKNICNSITYDYKLDSTVSGEAFINEPNDLTDMLISVIKKHTGKTAKLSTSGGTSDARFIKDYCPVVEFGLLNETAHHVNERAPIEHIYKLTEIYKEFIKRFFKIS